MWFGEISVGSTDSSKNTYTTNDSDANKPDDDDECVCMCRVIIETRKREREKRIEKECSVYGRRSRRPSRNREEEKTECFIFSLTANQLHDTTH